MALPAAKSVRIGGEARECRLSRGVRVLQVNIVNPYGSRVDAERAVRPLGAVETAGRGGGTVTLVAERQSGRACSP